jgi:hypothetical protein
MARRAEVKTQRLLVALTAVNLLFLLLTVALVRSTEAQTVPALVRARTLELLDDRGVVRARLGVKGPNGPIELDLFDRRGIVRVKLGTGDDGSGLLLTDEGVNAATRSYVQIIARRISTSERPKTTSITLKQTDGRERVITPP